MTPSGALTRGVVAGAAGTLAMDLLWFFRYKRGGGQSSFVEWEFAVGLDDWTRAPAPARVGKRLYEAFFQRELSPRWVSLTTNVMHWSYGIGWGGMYGLVAGAAPQPRLRWGVPFGALVFGTDYVILPLAGVYKPIWEYDMPTLWQDLSAHLVYGLATALTFRMATGARQ